MLRSLVLALAATVLVGPAAHGRSAAVVDQVDPTGDVSIFDGGGTKPSTAQRRTIDLERFTVTRTDGGVRLSYRIARITGSRTFDQIVAAQLQRPGRSDVALDVLANPQHRTGTAYVDGDTVCLVEVSTLRKEGIVRVDVPKECLPHGAGVLRVTTYTQEKNGSGPGFSEDTMRVKGRVTFSGALSPEGDGSRTQPPPTGAAAYMGMGAVADRGSPLGSPEV
jgi:hypothetical protein